MLPYMDDDPRGYRKRKGFKAKIGSLAGIIGWTLTVLLITVLWYTHSQKTKLHSEVDRHIQEKDGLLKQIGHLGESVSSKTRELQDLHTRHAHVSDSMNKRHEDAVRCSTEMEQIRNASIGFHARAQELERELRNERARFHTELEQERQKVRDLESQVAALKSQQLSPQPQPQPQPQPMQPQHVDVSNPPQPIANPVPVQPLHHETVVPNPQEGHADQHMAPVPGQQGSVHQVPETTTPPAPSDHSTVHTDSGQQQPQHAQYHHEVNGNEPQHHTRNQHGRRRGSISMLEEHLGMEHRHEGNEQNPHNQM